MERPGPPPDATDDDRAARRERCVVELRGTGRRVTCPRVDRGAANRLGHQLVGAVPRTLAEPVIRFSLREPAHDLLSFQLDAALVGRLGALGARVEICVNHDAPDLDRLRAVGCTVALFAHDLEPDDVTRRLGVGPTRAVPRRPHPTTGHPYGGSWELALTGAPPLDLARLLRELAARVPPAAVTAFEAHHHPHVSTSVRAFGFAGGFELDAGAVRALAQLGMPWRVQLIRHQGHPPAPSP